MWHPMAMGSAGHLVPIPGVTLILGDENFTFTPCFRNMYPNVPVEVACCSTVRRLLPGCSINMKKLRKSGVPIHFGVNPALLRRHFRNKKYIRRVVFVLPGIAFQGCPSFVDKQTDTLFKLRLHLFLFAFLRSSQHTFPENSMVQMVWPVMEGTEFSPDANGQGLKGLPWQPVDLEALAPFCKILRTPLEDELLDHRLLLTWRPFIHNIPTLRFPDYLTSCKLFSWRLKRNPEPAPAGIATVNILRIPPHIFDISREVLPHVNSLFYFDLQTTTGKVTISELSVKFDPRASGWHSNRLEPDDPPVDQLDPYDFYPM
eukprot:Lankesteria_metandrocarpae@DN5213_c0_g1_i2.p1